jgi:Holliday junction resolvasome RuvABC DNA-binding subunit
VTISQETRDKLDRAQALLRHRNPSGDLAQVLDHALDALLAKLEREKFGATSRPRAGRALRDNADPSYVPNDVRRAVHARDGEQCSFVSESGERCAERGFIELDHRTPVALGGQPTTDEIRVLCRVHNQYEAERLLGADFMRAKREEAAALRTPAASSLDADVSRALRDLGFKAAEVTRAMAATSSVPATTSEERWRAALAALMKSVGTRCSDGAFDVAGWACH